MKTTDSVMREFDDRFTVPGALTYGNVWNQEETTPDNVKAFISHSLAEARREEREQRDNVWKKIIACHNCNGTGRTDNIGGAMECIECGGQCHNLVRYDGIHIDDLLTGDNSND